MAVKKVADRVFKEKQRAVNFAPVEPALLEPIVEFLASELRTEAERCLNISSRVDE